MLGLLRSKDEKKDEKPLIHKDMTLKEAHAAMLQLMAMESTNHYRMGELFNYVVDSKLAEAAGYENAPEFFSKNLQDLSKSSLMMYGAVAANFSEPTSRRYGVTCCNLLLVYKEAADIEVNHEEPGGTVIEVPGANGDVTPKPFSHCTVEEMRQAIQRKRKPASSKPLPEADRTLADNVRKAVVGRFPQGVPVRVQLRNHKGKAVLDFKGIPVGQLARLTEALTAQLASMPRELEAEEAPKQD